MLARVLEYTLSGWPNYLTDKELKPYFTSRNGLTAEQDCVLWGMQVIFFIVFEERLLQELHQEH